MKLGHFGEFPPDLLAALPAAQVAYVAAEQFPVPRPTPEAPIPYHAARRRRGHVCGPRCIRHCLQRLPRRGAIPAAVGVPPGA